jgi:tRNA-dihydrouridine synthase B
MMISRTDALEPMLADDPAPRTAAERPVLAPRGSATEPVLALAPMQDLTESPFWDLIDDYGAADYYYTPYFRVHATSRLDADLIEAIQSSPSRRRMIGQLIGKDVRALVRSALELQRLPVVAVDLNLGCPAPIVCRKNVGGGLLRHLDRVDEILGGLRACLRVPFTVKTRLGYANSEAFETLLELFHRHAVDMVTVHARTVHDLYRGAVDYQAIARAVRRLKCPVLANGDIVSAGQALEVLNKTQAGGVMIGRGAIRNPWIFAQIRAALAGQPVPMPVGRDVLNYIHRLYTATQPPQASPTQQVKKIKKFMNFIGLGIEPSGRFLDQIRRASTEMDFFRICDRWLSHDDPMPLQPFPGLA